MTSAEIKQYVISKLEGLGERIRQRQAAMELERHANSIKRLRRHGLLESLAACRLELMERSITFTERKEYGMTTITACGVELYFDREGSLSYGRRIKYQSTSHQEDLFSSE